MNERRFPPMPGLRRLRKEFGVTLDELAELLHHNKRTITRWEVGELRPTEADISKLCEYFYCKKEELR